MTYTSQAVYEYISQQTHDTIVERRTCTVTWKNFPIYQSDQTFYEKISPVFGNRKYLIPHPTLCPEERERRRLLFRNERKLYRRTCDLTGRSIISIYSPQSSNTVYDQKAWRSDQRDALAYWIIFNSSISFLESFKKLLIEVPSFNLLNVNHTNSAYANHTLNLKDCYMCFSSIDSSSCINSRWSISSNECYDCTFIEQSEQCYNSVKLKNCYQLKDSNNCTSCSFSQYLSWCTNCKYCWNCTGLTNKTYCINNIQYTKEEYDALISISERQNLSQIKAWQHQQNCEDSYGNDLINCKNCIFVSGVSDAEFVKYTFDDWYYKNCFDCYGAINSEYCLEMMSGWNSYNCWYICYWNRNKNVWYSSKVYDCQDCFWCVWLRNAQYCILNTQYTKEEYEILVPQIIQQMQEAWERWEFFNASLSPFCYNETVAQDYYPLTRQEALQRWCKRLESETPINIPNGTNTIEWKNIPNTIQEIDDTILSQAIICETSWRPFRIIKPELEFYRKHAISLPRKHPDVRHQERLAQRPWRTLHLRKCDKTQEEILSVYPTDYDGTIYSQAAYQQEIYW